MWRSRRAMILLMTLSALGLVMVLLLGFIQLQRAMYPLTGHLGDQSAADWAAVGGVQKALLQVKRDNDWSQDLRETLASDATLAVTWDSTGEEPWSTNNAAGNTPVTGWDGRTVPAHWVHVVCVARCGTSERRHEALASVSDTGKVEVHSRW